METTSNDVHSADIRGFLRFRKNKETSSENSEEDGDVIIVGEKADSVETSDRDVMKTNMQDEEMEENEELENDQDKEVSQSTDANKDKEASQSTDANKDKEASQSTDANKDKEVSQSTDAIEVDANSTINNEDEVLQGEGVKHIETKETDDFLGQPSLA